MALVWDFNYKCGTITFLNGRTAKEETYNIYQGNAFLIVLDEDEKTYNLITFFADSKHCRNCLGLSKGFSNIFETNPVTKITIYHDIYGYSSQLVKHLIDAFPNIKITLIHSPDSERRGDSK